MIFGQKPSRLGNKLSLLIFEKGEMRLSTVNIVLMMILSVMIGFGIGNIYGKEMMKKTLSDMIKTFIASIEKAAKDKKEQ